MIRSYVKSFEGQWPVITFGLICAFLSSPGQTFFISMFVPPIAQSLQVSAGQIGLLYLGATLGAAVLLPATGHWLDRVDLRLYTVIVLATLAAACGLLSVASGPVSLFLSLLLLRLTGQGLMTHISVVSIARHFDRLRGRALSLVAFGLPLSEALMPSVALASIASLGWRASYGAIGIIVVSVAAPFLLLLIRGTQSFRRPVSVEHQSLRPRALDGMRIVAATPFFWMVLPIIVFLPFASTALIFHIRAIAVAKGLGNELLGAGFVGLAVAHAVSLLASGEFIDRFGGRSMLATMNVPFLIGVMALGVFDHVWTLPAFLALTGVSAGLVRTAVAAAWAEAYGVTRLGTVRSFGTMVTVAASAVGPAVVGALLDWGLSIGSISGLLALYGSAAAILAAFGVRSKSQLHGPGSSDESAE